MRDFKEPFYEGKQCKCCSPKPPTETVGKAYARGVKEERDRIIKLLKDLLEEKSGVTLKGAIVFIEGENK